MSSSGAMKPPMLILLLALLCAERAQGLRCYQCFASTDDSSCPETACAYPDGVCVTQEVEGTAASETVRVKNRFCLPSCPEGNLATGSLQVLGATVNTRTSCCKTDLCNAGFSLDAGAGALMGSLLLSLVLVFWTLA